MSVVNTLSQLYKLCEMSRKHEGGNLIETHHEILCNPLKSFFPNRTVEEIHFELLRNGLFNPYEGFDIEETLKELDRKNIWLILQKEFEKLSSLWEGPEIPIYIFPLTRPRPFIAGVEANKNGVAYNGVLFLFVSTELGEDELKALLAHEYHHICRLNYMNISPQEIELIDSLIIEGMAEWSVEEVYGEVGMSPWTKRYSLDEVKEQWQKYFVPALHLRGVASHRPFLYGDGSVGLPRWIGYCLGYRIIESYVNHSGPVKQNHFYKISSNQILQGSDFKL